MKKCLSVKSIIAEDRLVKRNRNVKTEDLPKIYCKLDINSVKSINLSKNRISDLSFSIGSQKICVFSDFVNLEKIDLSDNPLRSLYYFNFKNCTKLQFFKMERCGIQKATSLSFLKHLKKVVELSIRGHDIYGMNLKKFLKIYPKINPELIELDIRCRNQRYCKTLKKEEQQLLLKHFQNIEIYNGSLIDEIKVVEKSRRFSEKEQFFKIKFKKKNKNYRWSNQSNLPSKIHQKVTKKHKKKLKPSLSKKNLLSRNSSKKFKVRSVQRSRSIRIKSKDKKSKGLRRNSSKSIFKKFDDQPKTRISSFLSGFEANFQVEKENQNENTSK